MSCLSCGGYVTEGALCYRCRNENISTCKNSTIKAIERLTDSMQTYEALLYGGDGLEICVKLSDLADELDTMKIQDLSQFEMKIVDLIVAHGMGRIKKRTHSLIEEFRICK